jgi:hypothetical protein
MKSACFFLSLMGISAALAVPPKPEWAVNVKKDEAQGTVTVTIGGQPFATLHYSKFAKPVLGPVVGPTGATMTRQWPITEKAALGEETDHPHHKGLWFTHGAVNGVDFWSENPKAGKITVKGEPRVGVMANPGNHVVIHTDEEWKAPDGKLVCTSATTITCTVNASTGTRFIDYTITISASEGDVTFGDTKEGTMGLRSHPALNLKGKAATGKAVNSEGESGAAIWGKHARWVDYSGTVDGKAVGIACFDHPSNLRHPTTWHARDYGLIAANPFGLSDFEKKPKGTGDHTIKKDESLTLRYRWLFHTGDAAAAKVEENWKEWAGK